MLITSPKKYPALGVGILPFDSASTAKLGAHGKLSAAAVNTCRATAGEESLFWIAAVHHHPLPIPYDSKYESVMIMENAGTLLQELIKHKVPLIIHGHKHHQHFSRLLVRTKDGEDRELSVLAAGTPTEGYQTGPYHHSFNVLRLRQGHEVEISVFEAETNATFGKVKSISLTSKEVYAKRHFEQCKNQKNLSCERIFSSADINEYGDARFAREFSGVITTEVIESFPHDFPVLCESGEIFDIWAASSSNHGPNVWSDPKWISSGHVTCDVHFGGSRLNPQTKPFDFHIEHRASNAFALDSTQYGHMYPGHKDNMESMLYTVPDCIATKELVIQLRFPPETKLPTNITLQRAIKREASDDEWHDLPSETITFVHTAPMIMARILAPTPGSAFRFHWQVDLVSRPQIGFINTFEKALNSFDSEKIAKPMEQFLEDTLQLALNTLIEPGDFDSARREAAVTLFAYDRDKGCLHAVGKLNPSKVGTQGEAYRYGNGLAGRALKSRRVTVHDKDAPETIEGAMRLLERYQLMSQQREKSGKDSEVSDGKRAYSPEAIYSTEIGSALAFPIPPGNVTSGEPFAVIQISFNDFNGRIKFSDTYSDRSQSEFHAAANQLLQDFITESILSK